MQNGSPTIRTAPSRQSRTIEAQESDDIWLRRPDRPARDSADIRLTNIGFEAGPPSWSRDGMRLVFASYDRKGTPGIAPVDDHARYSDRSPGPGRERAAADGREVGVMGSLVADSDEIAIEAPRAREFSDSLWRMRSDGSGARKVIDFPQMTLRWSRMVA